MLHGTFTVISAKFRHIWHMSIVAGPGPAAVAKTYSVMSAEDIVLNGMLQMNE